MQLLEPMHPPLAGATREFALPESPAVPSSEAGSFPSVRSWPTEAPGPSRLGHGLAWGLGLSAAFWLVLAVVLLRIFG